ncbi:helix-turn-helix transcriptional regulator [Cytophagaceae bacterium YF14B1]|uniref:Helix-turn-helix transcriptional regulator n=1 Tax=Xanthocytophaga flava TaxID=3048013 RepID=A0AAE3QUY4_9BACT|nr:helix-turn-helix transcriptional regulator [Xanthocytophaga flavus]MDJ1485481.1 helix-turn-helix transcriptional regulator [Xanthocytophaga flavus]
MYSKDLIRGTLTPIILKLLYPNRKMYGYEICQKVKELTNEDLLIKEGSLYPALHKLMDDGLINVEEVLIGNRPRRYYQLTAEGKLEAEHRTTELNRFLKTMQLFLEKATNSL